MHEPSALVRNAASLHVLLGIQSSNQYILFPEVRLVKVLCTHNSRNYFYMTVFVLACFSTVPVERCITLVPSTKTL